MIKRVVLLKLTEEYANTAGRDKVARHAQRVLPLLPGVVRVEVGQVAIVDDAPPPEWDVTLMVELERIEDYPRYRDDPDHRAFLDEFLKPRTVARASQNFIVEEPPE